MASNLLTHQVACKNSYSMPRIKVRLIGAAVRESFCIYYVMARAEQHYSIDLH
jgi:hypothetical protein